MGKIEIHYQLNREGQKADLKAGGTGKADQVIDATDAAFHRDKLIELGEVTSDGDVKVYVESGKVRLGSKLRLVERLCGPYPYRTVESTPVYDVHPPSASGRGFSAPLSIEEAIENVESLAQRRAECQAQEQEARQQLEAETEGEYEAAKAKRQADRERDAQETQRRFREEKAERKRKQEEAEQEMHQWIDAHGSERLKLIRKHGLLEDSMNVYREERLQRDRPGWIFDHNWHDGNVDHLTPRNPSLETMQWADAVIEQYPDAELVFASYDEPVREMIMKDYYLGRLVVLRQE